MFQRREAVGHGQVVVAELLDGHVDLTAGRKEKARYSYKQDDPSGTLLDFVYIYQNKALALPHKCCLKIYYFDK